MALQVLAPDAILLQTNLVGAVTDIDEPVGSPDASWLTAASATVASILRVSFPSPSAGLRTGAGLQQFRVWVRKLNFSGTPTATIELWQAGVLTATLLAATNVTSPTGQLLTATWDATGVTAADVELRITGTVGGSGGNRSTIEVGAVEWNAEDGNITLTVVKVSGSASISTPGVQVQSNASSAPARVVGAASIPTPAVVAQTRALPTRIACSASIPTPAVKTDQSASPVRVAGVVTIATPITKLSQIFSSVKVSGVVTVPIPVVKTAITPIHIFVPVSIPQPVVETTVVKVATRVAGSTTIPLPVIKTPKLIATRVAGRVTIPTPFILAQILFPAYSSKSVLYGETVTRAKLVHPGETLVVMSGSRNSVIVSEG